MSDFIYFVHLQSPVFLINSRYLDLVSLLHSLEYKSTPCPKVTELFCRVPLVLFFQAPEHNFACSPVSDLVRFKFKFFLRNFYNLFYIKYNKIFLNFFYLNIIELLSSNYPSIMIFIIKILGIA